MTITFLRQAAALLCAMAFATGAAAQTAPATPGLSLSLNALETQGDGCRMTFVVRNAMAGEISELGVEVAIFRAGGALDRLMRLNLGLMLEGKTRVRQFDLDGTPCEAIDSVLVNDVTSCTGEGLTPLDCMRALTVTTNANVGFSL